MKGIACGWLDRETILQLAEVLREPGHEGSFLGGCLYVSGKSPAWFCADCHNRFGVYWEPPGEAIDMREANRQAEEILAEAAQDAEKRLAERELLRCARKG